MVLFAVWASVLCLCSCVYPNASRDVYNCRSTRTANYRRQLREAGAAMTTHSHLDATTKTWHKPDEPRAFTLKFDQTKLKSANPVRRLEYQEKKEVEGVLFTSGACILDRSYVCYFSSLSEMEESFSTIGHYTLTWHDSGEEING